MTAKDLNLNFDRGLIAPGATQAGSAGSTAAVATAAAGSRPKKQAPPPWHRRQQRTATTAMVIAVANMLFLVLAGLWLTGHRLPGADRPAAVTPAPTARLEAKMDQIDRQLVALERQIQALQGGVSQQGEHLAVSFSDFREQIEETLSHALAAAQAQVAARRAPPVEKPWYVSLGSFSTEDARGLREELQTLGYQAQLSSRDEGNPADQKLVLPGFKDRESAELAATALMQQTRLDSLWVWKDE